MNTNSSPQQADNFAANATISQVDQDKEIVGRFRRQPVASTKSDFEDFLTHPVKILHVTWNSTTTTAVVVKDLVASYLSSLPVGMSKKIANLYYFKSDIKITVVVQGAAQSYGQMVLAFTPQTSLALETVSTRTIDTNQVQNLRIVPHLTIDPSKNQTYELELPVDTPTGFFQVLSNAENHGSYLFEMHIVNPLRTGTAAVPVVNVCVYMSLVNPEFEALTTLTSNGYENEKASSIVDSISYYSALAAPYSGIFQPGVRLFSEVTGVASKVLRWFGFSKPPQGDITAVALTRTCDNYSQIEGLSSAIVLGCSQKQSLAIDPAYGLGRMDDMSISKIISHQSPIILDQTITSAAASESFAFQILVHPLVSLFGNTPTPLCGFAFVSQFWCGDIDYSIEFIASPFTRATILIAWDPFGVSTATQPSFSDALTILQNTTVQVVGNTVVDLTIPYKSYMPVLSTNLNNLYAPVVPATTGESGSSNGMLYFYVLNPVIDNGSTTPTLAINVWVSSKNLVFLGCTNEPLSSGTFGVVTTTLTSNGYEMAPSASISFGPPTDLSTISQRVTGDPIRTVKDIVSRMDFLFRETSDAVSKLGMIFEVPNMPVVCTTDNSSLVSMTRFGWIASAFYGYRGSTKLSSYSTEVYSTTAGQNGKLQTLAYHTVMQQINSPYSVGNFTLPAMTGAIAAMAWTHPNLEVTSRNDVVVPMMIGADFFPSRVFPTSHSDGVVVIFERSSNLAEAAVINSAFFQGAGDDAVFTWFLGFPRIL